MIELLKDASNNYLNFAVTNCGHKFCLPCIIRYGKKNNECPLCRNMFLDPECFTPNTYVSVQDFFDEDMRDIRDNQDLRLDSWLYNSWQDEIVTISQRENVNEYRNFMTAFRPRNRTRTITIQNISDTNAIQEFFTENYETTYSYNNEPEPQPQDFSDFYYDEESVNDEYGPFQEEVIAIESDIESEESETPQNTSNLRIDTSLNTL